MLWTLKKSLLLRRRYSPQIVSLIEVIRRLGLTQGLEVCLDAGDAVSAPAATQTWFDLSGNGFGFFVGGTGAVTTSDPTFNGSVGGLSANEYWSNDGGDQFTYDTTNEVWMENLHKNNALFTIAGWIYPAPIASEHSVFRTGSTAATDTGITFREIVGGNMRLNVLNASGSPVYSVTSVATLLINSWNFVAITVNEAVGTGLLQINEQQEAISPTYVSPSSGAATFTAAGFLGFDAGSRMRSLAVWEGRGLVASEVRSLYQATRGQLAV